MKYKLRPYQQEAVDATMSHIRKSVASAVVVLPTGAGKSLIVAELARLINEMSAKRVLCLAPSKELVLQNREKYLLTGEPAGLFSASAGAKNLRHPVVFGSPLTVKGAIDMFGERYGAVIVDEAHNITPTVKFILESMIRRNPKLRVIVLTATPYRMLTGYIYKDHYLNGPTEEGEHYFDKVVYELSAQRLIDEGFLTPPKTANQDGYDTSHLELDRKGQFTTASVEQAFEGQGRKTAAIIADVVDHARDRRGVMIFAATRQHGREIMESLPPELSAFVTGDLHVKERERMISAFKAQKIKYIVNVQVLTTGFDAPHVDLIAILRATESPGLFQQIIGRGLRLFPGKKFCDIRDYAGNIERHFSNSGDLFAPDMRVKKKKESEPMIVECPSCHYWNEFARRPNPEKLEIDAEGYLLDLAGDRVMVEGLPLPGHFGRRCKGYVFSGPLNEMVRCSQKWSTKKCPKCDAENDITARYCSTCKAEIVDPNAKLEELAASLDASPYATKQQPVTHMSILMHYNSEGNHTIKVDFAMPEIPHFVTKYFDPNSEKAWLRKQWHEFCRNAFGDDKTLEEALEERQNARMASVVMYRRDKGSRYHNVVGMYWGEV